MTHISKTSTLTFVLFRMKFKTVWLWPLIDTLNSSIDWENLGERLYVTTTAHYVLFKDAYCYAFTFLHWFEV